jgi:hypothetical protein
LIWSLEKEERILSIATTSYSSIYFKACFNPAISIPESKARGLEDLADVCGVEGKQENSLACTAIFSVKEQSKELDRPM